LDAFSFCSLGAFVLCLHLASVPLPKTAPYRVSWGKVDVPLCTLCSFCPHSSGPLPRLRHVFPVLFLNHHLSSFCVLYEVRTRRFAAVKMGRQVFPPQVIFAPLMSSPALRSPPFLDSD